MGGATVLLAGSRNPDGVIAVIDDCGYSSCKEEYEYECRKIFHLPSVLVVPFFRFWTKNRIGLDFYSINPAEATKSTKIPTLFIHGRCDKLVPLWMTNKNYQSCGARNKQIHLIEDAGHAECQFKDKREYCRIIDQFLSSVMHQSVDCSIR